MLLRYSPWPGGGLSDPPLAKVGSAPDLGQPPSCVVWGMPFDLGQPKLMKITSAFKIIKGRLANIGSAPDLGQGGVCQTPPWPR